MDFANDLMAFMQMAQSLTAENRPLRLRLALPEGVVDDVLLPQRVVGAESLCGGLEYRIDCVATDAQLPLKLFIALPAELQFVTDRGGLRKVCGIVTQARAGRSDGGLASYQLVIRDAFAILQQRVNTRVFRRMNEIDIVEILLNEWWRSSSMLAAALDIEIDPAIFSRQYPVREFTKQHNESDAGFIMRLLKRRGICWFFRAGNAGSADRGEDDTPAHTLVLFDDAGALRENAAGSLRYHRDDATEQRDTVTAWSAVRTLRPASVARYSWNYKNPQGTQFMTTGADSAADQGEAGNAIAASLNDYLVDIPHVGDDHEDQALLGRVRLSRHDFESKCFYGEGAVRDLCVGEFNALAGHPEIDTHPDGERAFVVTELHVVAENNLAPELARPLRALFSDNGWHEVDVFGPLARHGTRAAVRAVRYHNRFTCVRRGVAIVPGFDPRADVPVAHMESAIVVGPAGEEIHCDDEGRIRLRFPGTRAEDHAHADGAGASGTDGDSAWVRVASSWAGPGPGGDGQYGLRNLPRVGTEVLVAYLGGDPDRPVVVGQLYNSDGLPPGLNSVGGLPDSKFLSGLQSRESRGMRNNQLRLDDTPGEISAQLASAHASSELNLGHLTTPRFKGQGIARGEGAELRSERAVALRGGQGILLSAAQQPGGPGAMLERDDLIGMVEVLRGMASELASFAATHAGDAAEGPQMAQLLARLKAWDAGTNVAPGATDGGAPMIAASAPAGMVLASQDALALGAADKLDVQSGGDTQLSSGRKLLQRAVDGISQFALRLGIKLIAAGGDIRVQAHDGGIDITAARRIRIVAGEGVDIEAPELRFVAKGAQVDCGGGQITQQCSGDFAVKSGRFVHSAGGDGDPAKVDFPKSILEADERIVLTEQQSRKPVKNRAYKATLADGSVISGQTDGQGWTGLYQDADIGVVVIEVDKH